MIFTFWQKIGLAICLSIIGYGVYWFFFGKLFSGGPQG